MSSAAEGYGSGGGGGGQEQLLHHYHHQTYHVPQHSRREKLRFPPEESPPSTSFFFHHDPNSLTTFFPSSSSSSSYYSPNPSYAFSPTTQFSGHQGFSLSLASCSSSSSKPPPPSLPHPQFTAGPASKPAGPFGPFTGYAVVLNRSRFLEPARQLLEEICDVGRRQGVSGGGGGMLLDADPPELSSLDHREMEGLAGGEVEGGISGSEQQWKKTRLVSMLDEVYIKYKQYHQQVQAVITSFESVAGLSTAAPYASMALKAMLKHFRCLKNKISNQLSYTNKVLRTEGLSREESSSFGLINCGAGLQRAPNDSGTFGQIHVWRPQRGLPERAVSVLRAWLFEHFLHPYPTDTDKQMLAKQTGLTRNQVSNWFINARVRLWKPMVEEIHSLEMRQLHKAPPADRNHNTVEQTQLPSESIAPPSSSQPLHSSSSSQKNQNPSTVLFQDDLTHIPSHIQEPLNFVYDEMDVAGGAEGDVSLTLGLHQNNSVCLAEPLPMNVVRRFGLEDCSDAYVMGAFEAQDRHFGKDTWRAFPS